MSKIFANEIPNLIYNGKWMVNHEWRLYSTIIHYKQLPGSTTVKPAMCVSLQVVRGSKKKVIEYHWIWRKITNVSVNNSKNTQAVRLSYVKSQDHFLRGIVVMNILGSVLH